MNNMMNNLKGTGLFLLLCTILTSCHKEATVEVSQPNISAGQEITTDTLSGSIKGTLLTGKTYYFSSDIRINKGDTLLMQPGSKLIAIGDGGQETSPQITNSGTFISIGTSDNPNFVTVLPSQRIEANVCVGIWGGIQCDSTANLIIKWTHLEFAGAPAGSSADPALYSAGDPRYTIAFTNINGICILEDSWIFGSADDGMRVVSGMINIMRNTFESCGKQGGESLNLKSGTVGNVAYNVSIGAATNSFKVSNNKGSTAVQSNVYVYNNTILNGGYRQVKDGRGGSINYEQGASGDVYNNFIINCRFGMRFTSDADTNHIDYGYNYYYAEESRIVSQFVSTDGVAHLKTTDIYSTTPKANDPYFSKYDVNLFDFASYTSVKTTLVLDLTQMPTSIRYTSGYNFSLLPTSGAIGKGFTDFTPLDVITLTGNYAPIITAPGQDIGAYQTDGTGNQHYTSSLDASF